MTGHKEQWNKKVREEGEREDRKEERGGIVEYVRSAESGFLVELKSAL